MEATAAAATAEKESKEAAAKAHELCAAVAAEKKALEEDSAALEAARLRADAMPDGDEKEELLRVTTRQAAMLQAREGNLKKAQVGPPFFLVGTQ